MIETTQHHFEGQSVHEEMANSITHGIGALLALAATSILIVHSAMYGSAVKIVGVSVFGFTLVALYTASTLYHGIQTARVKHIFHIFDHSAIFTLIAGTYTPITLCAIQGALGWSLFGIIWGIAILGIVSTAVFFEKARYFNIALYIAMGWIVVLAGPKLFSALSFNALLWLSIGGVLYTGGTLFYRDKKHRFAHMIWHTFVIAASTCHFFMMFYI